jgi:Fe-S-cluster containining protein
VYLTESDVVRIAEFLHLSQAEFERRHVYRTKRMIRLRMARAAPCRFLNASGCSVHSVKPLQCSAFPFWPELLESEKEWHKTASWCPGIGKGELINIESAKATADEVRRGHPHYYESR